MIGLSEEEDDIELSIEDSVDNVDTVDCGVENLLDIFLSTFFLILTNLDIACNGLHSLSKNFF